MENFRAAMGDYLDRVSSRGEKFVITRNQIPFVSLKPVPQRIQLEKVQTRKAKEVRTNISETLGAVHFQGKTLLITRRGKPTAIVRSLRQSGSGALI